MFPGHIRGQGVCAIVVLAASGRGKYRQHQLRQLELPRHSEHSYATSPLDHSSEPAFAIIYQGLEQAIPHVELVG